MATADEASVHVSGLDRSGYSFESSLADIAIMTLHLLRGDGRNAERQAGICSCKYHLLVSCASNCLPLLSRD